MLKNYIHITPIVVPIQIKRLNVFISKYFLSFNMKYLLKFIMNLPPKKYKLSRTEICYFVQ